MVFLGASINAGNPNWGAFMDSVYWFAVYNSILGAALVILTYICTTLMNMAAYNQVITNLANMYRCMSELFKIITKINF